MMVSRAEQRMRYIDLLEDENHKLKRALHDAIRRPMGVIPDSAREFYNETLAFEAEKRRREMSPIETEKGN